MSSSSSSALTVVEKLIKLLRSEEDDSFTPQNTNISITLEDWSECHGMRNLWNLISQEKYIGVVKKIILDEVLAYCKHLRRCSFNKNLPLFHDDPNFFPRSLNHLDDQIIFDLIAECIRYCYSSVVKGRGLCPEFNILVITLTLLARLRKYQTYVSCNMMDAEANHFLVVDFFGPRSLIDTLVSRTDSYQAYVEQVKLKNCRQPIYDLDEGMTKNLEEPLKDRDLNPYNLELLDSLGRCKEKTVDPSCKVVSKAAQFTVVSSYLLGSRRVAIKLAMLSGRGKKIGTSINNAESTN